MQIEPEFGGVAIVLRGDFNPTIYTPAWFAMHGLLPENAADGAAVEAVHSEVAAFGFDWLRLTSTTDRFQCETAQAPLSRVRDFVASMFGEHLRHTPLRALGIDRHVHFRVRSPAERDHIGRTLAPVAPWGDWGKVLGFDGEYGGLTSLTMSQNNPENRPDGDLINIKVEPSLQIDDKRTGVYVLVNDHYTTDGAGPGSAERLMEVLEANFDASLKRSDGLIDHVMSLATK